jgi:hypothetical protein
MVSSMANYVVDQVRASGASQHAIDEKVQEMRSIKAWYDNPLINAAVTFVELFPIGLIVSLVSAAILRRRKPKNRETVVGEPLASS